MKKKLLKNKNTICSVRGCYNFYKPGADFTSRKLCIRHGGGYKCTYPNCTKLAMNPYNPKDKKTIRCLSHGGGYRCKYKNCTSHKIISSKFQYCRGHTRNNYVCIFKYCKRRAGKASNGKILCLSHGYDGPLCFHEKCNQPRIYNDTLCIAHTKRKCFEKDEDYKLRNFCDFLLEKRYINYYQLRNIEV